LITSKEEGKVLQLLKQYVSA